jgi:murein DD-endopeptidase / murein LD-carboxypeptidase
MKADYAARARALVGIRFRPQGRAPDLGLDCVGLIICAFGLPADLVRRDYRMRGNHGREMLGELAKPFRKVPRKHRRPGDVLLLEVACDQLHLAILTETGFVHADARRGKVVQTPGMPPWPIVGAFRRRTGKQGSV